jgi:predicted adenylyl cyclase CyaB
VAVAHGGNRRHSQEAELKFRLRGAAEQAKLRDRLRQLKATALGAYDEENVRYRPVRKQAVTLRLRIIDGGPQGVLTVKGPAKYERRIKVREETEVLVSDALAMRDVLEALGHKVAVVYHKHRETWQLDGCHVTLDTLDFGFFSEVEGPVDVIEGVAGRLRLDGARALKSSYSELARSHRRD